VGVRVKLRSPRKPLVLVVDDDVGVREALHLVLEEELRSLTLRTAVRPSMQSGRDPSIWRSWIFREEQHG
jgi:hypothetical protein